VARMNEQLPPMLVCDLTQSYSPKGGGGITTYLAEKRRYVLESTPHRLIQIVPGPEDKVVVDGRHTWIEVGSEPVRGSANYRFITRTSKVRSILERYQPDIIENQCPWLLPWTSIRYRRAHPETTLVAGYHTDFPDAQVHRVAEALWGRHPARFWRMMAMGYAEITYREFDRVYTLGDKGSTVLGQCQIERRDQLDLGVDTGLFHPSLRDPAFRAEMGLPGDGPLLIYAGRIDVEKRADRLAAMMRHLPPEMGAALVMIGDGKLSERLRAESAGLPIALPGFFADRAKLARALASSDIYVSAMPDETFGISIVEAQACGLPVVGVASGAMPERVPADLGLLGPVDDVAAMARNVQAIWRGEVGGGMAAISLAARSHVEARYDWSRTFDRLFDDIYPAALATTRERLVTGEKWRMSKLITVPVAPLLAWGGGHDAPGPRRTSWKGARAIGQDTFEPG
jgi:alpha-1,6-mannosyltransferase